MVSVGPGYYGGIKVLIRKASFKFQPFFSSKVVNIKNVEEVMTAMMTMT